MRSSSEGSVKSESEEVTVGGIPTVKAAMVPDYNVFLEPDERTSIPWMVQFLKSLVPGAPRIIPFDVDVNDMHDLSIQREVYGRGPMLLAARRLNLPVRVFTIGGELWACLLKGEDAAKIIWW